MLLGQEFFLKNDKKYLVKKSELGGTTNVKSLLELKSTPSKDGIIFSYFISWTKYFNQKNIQKNPPLKMVPSGRDWCSADLAYLFKYMVCRNISSLKKKQMVNSYWLWTFFFLFT